MKHKENYVSPQIEVIPMETEGVIAGSGNLPGVGDGGGGYRTAGTYRSGSTRGYNGSAVSDLEDMINNILTIEQ